METVQNQEEDISRFQGFLERFAILKERYGDQYPVIMYEPEIESKEKKNLKDLIKVNQSVHLFAEFKEALKFSQSLEIGFLLIVSSDFEEQMVLRNFQSFQNAYGREMFDFEEKELLEGLFGKDCPVQPLGLKAYAFCTVLDLMTEAPINEDDVMVMSKIKDMAQKFKQESVVIWYDPNLHSTDKEILTKEIDIEEGNIYGDFMELEKRISDSNSPPYHLVMTSKVETEKIVSEMDKLKAFLLSLYIYSDDPEIAKTRNRKILIASTLKELVPKLKKGIREKSILVNSFPAFATDFDALDKSHLYDLHYYLTLSLRYFFFFKKMFNFNEKNFYFFDLQKGFFSDQHFFCSAVLQCFEFHSKLFFDFFITEANHMWDSPIFIKIIEICGLDMGYATGKGLKGLINFKNRKQAKEDFLSLAKIIYESKKLFEFEKEYDDYDKREIFRWYAMESPVYKLINNCLRIASSDSILYCRYILKDLERAIQEGYRERNYNGVVYRGAYIQKEEWEKLQKNVGKEIEMYGFLSTSQKIDIAKNFLFSDLQNKILITIIIPPLPVAELNEQGFTNISQNSGFQEAEILFNVRSKFRILEAGMTKINDQGKECRHLILLYGPQILRKFMTKRKPRFDIKLESSSGERKCDLCESKTCLFGWTQENKLSCVRCFDCLLKNSIPRDVPLIALDAENKAEENLVKSFKGSRLEFSQGFSFALSDYKCQDCGEKGKEKYYKWIDSKSGNEIKQCSECFVKNKEVKFDILVSESMPYAIWREEQKEDEIINDKNDVELRKTLEYQSQGEVYLEVESFDLCVKYGENMIRKLARKRKREVQKLMNFSILGRAFERLGKHQTAKEYLVKTLEITKIIYGEKSFYVSTLHNDLALIYKSLDDYQNALESYMKSLDITISTLGELNPQAAASYNNLGLLYEEMKDHEKALEHHKKALHIRRFVHGEKSKDTAASYNNLGMVYESLRKHEIALQHFHKALAIRISIYGEKHTLIAHSYQNIGIFYESSGEYAQALEFHLRALDIVKQIDGENHLNTVKTYMNIASVYRHLRNHGKSMEYYMKALEIIKHLNLQEHAITAKLYTNIALLFGSFGQHSEALDHHNKALEIRKSLYGERHIEIADSYDGLGGASLGLKAYDFALECHNKALNIRKEKYGEVHASVANSYNNLANVFLNLRNDNKALECYIKALNIRKSLHGEIHRDVNESYFTLARVYEQKGDYQKALEYYQKSLDIIKSIYGENHAFTADAHNTLATVFRRLKEYQKAIKHYMSALDIIKSIDGEQHQDVAMLYHNIALVYAEGEMYSKALEFHLKVLNIRVSIYGEKNSIVISSYNDIAILCQKMNNLKKAKEYFTKALNLSKSTVGKQSLHVAASYTSLALVSEALKEYSEALEYYWRALEIRQKIRGNDHSEVEATYNGIALVYESSGDNRKALEYFKKAFEIAKMIYKEDHQNIFNSYTDLAKIYEKLGEYQNASEYYNKALKIVRGVYGENHASTQYFKKKLYEISQKIR